MTTAERVAKQRTDALKLANEVRMANGRVLREIREMSQRDGIERVIEIVQNPESPTSTLPVSRLLMSVRQVREVRMAKLLQIAQIFDAQRRLDKLTDRQRYVLVGALRTWTYGR